MRIFPGDRLLREIKIGKIIFYSSFRLPVISYNGPRIAEVAEAKAKAIWAKALLRRSRLRIVVRWAEHSLCYYHALSFLASIKNCFAISVNQIAYPMTENVEI